MGLDGLLEHRDGFVALAAGMQRDGVDIGISRAAGIELGSLS